MNLQETTQAAAQAAELSMSAIRQAHRAACSDYPDQMEILLLEALGDAVKLHQRLQAIAACAASPRYAAQPEPGFETDGGTYSLSNLLAANSDDPDLCAWLRRAAVGDRYGGGAGGSCWRIS